MADADMASDLADAIVTRAEQMQRFDVEQRSRRLVLSRGTASASATFTGDGDDYVRIALSMKGDGKDDIFLRYLRRDGEEAYECCGWMLLQQLWTAETADEFGGASTVAARIAGELVASSIHFTDHICVLSVLPSWKGFKIKFKLLMHIL